MGSNEKDETKLLNKQLDHLFLGYVATLFIPVMMKEYTENSIMALMVVQGFESLVFYFLVFYFLVKAMRSKELGDVINQLSLALFFAFLSTMIIGFILAFGYSGQLMYGFWLLIILQVYHLVTLVRIVVKWMH